MQISSIGPAHLSLLKVFISASYSAYLAAPELPALTPLQHRTLRKLTLLKAVQGLTVPPSPPSSSPSDTCSLSCTLPRMR